ncbi:hypothetical protein [Streptosporangium carneum]|uniref:Uncharacterized protein n=1 Tax=Streptosporangium carneum TaxID=47481 RepID=A0A9W6I3C7_9ACTN|nr:hypothetical protein [Streptosporangium carneum]GLK10433.1 hypothetical protein GCM10017600_38390 [Streptosporangium carneum]
MNPPPQAAAVPPQVGPHEEPQEQSEAVLLTLLQDALLRRGVRAELRDNVTALMIPRPDVGMPVWVFVGYGGAYFSWQSAERRHSVNDLDGAAQVLADYVGR